MKAYVPRQPFGPVFDGGLEFRVPVVRGEYVGSGQGVRLAGVHALQGRLALGKQIPGAATDHRIVLWHTEIQQPVQLDHGPRNRFAEGAVLFLRARDVDKQFGKGAAVFSGERFSQRTLDEQRVFVVAVLKRSERGVL